MVDDGSIARYRTNLQGEVDSAALYRAMAEAVDLRIFSPKARTAPTGKSHP